MTSACGVVEELHTEENGLYEGRIDRNVRAAIKGQKAITAVFVDGVDGVNVDMPPKELELLYFLASSPNQVFTREQLLDQIWGYEYIGDTRTVDVHIKRLREKIKDHPSWRLSTVWGIGYKFEVKE